MTVINNLKKIDDVRKSRHTEYKEKTENTHMHSFTLILFAYAWVVLRFSTLIFLSLSFLFYFSLLVHKKHLAFYIP